MYTADAFSRTPVPIDCTIAEEENDACLIQALVIVLPVEQDHLHEYQHAQKHDTVCSKPRDCCRQSWPSKHQIKGELNRYWPVRGEFTCVDDMVL